MTSPMNAFSAVILCACALLAACGGGGTPSSSQKPAPATAVAATSAPPSSAQPPVEPGSAGVGEPLPVTSGGSSVAHPPAQSTGPTFVQSDGQAGFGPQWSETTLIQVQNRTGGRWLDSEIYWAIIGRDWNTHQFVHVNAAGDLVPMSTADNGALTKSARAFSNYFFKLSQTSQITLPPIDSARLLISVGSPMYIWVNTDVNGQIGYAGADLSNPTDPNLDVYFDFIELASPVKGISSQGIFANTSRVDQFGFPLQMRLEGLGGYDRTVGEPLNESRDQIFARYATEVPPPFAPLAQAPYAPYRIVAPSHAAFSADGSQGHYLDAYIDSMWQEFASRELTFGLQNLGSFVGQVIQDRFVFRGGNDNGVYFINGKPSTEMVLLGNGLLNDSTGGSSQVLTQLQIQAQVCAALNRHVLDEPSAWYDATKQYGPGTASNWYARFWHAHNIDGLSYGFAYDDVGNLSSSLHSDAPTRLTISVGW